VLSLEKRVIHVVFLLRRLPNLLCERIHVKNDSVIKKRLTRSPERIFILNPMIDTQPCAEADVAVPDWLLSSLDTDTGRDGTMSSL